MTRPALLSWLSRGRLCRPSLFCPATRERGQRGGRRAGRNDFEIFVAVHKFEGGGYAYLNTDRTLFPASSSPLRGRLLLLLARPPLLLPRRRPRLVLPLCWILPHLFSPSSFFFFISSSSFRVPTSIVSRALINYPEGHPAQIPLSLLLFLLARTGNEQGPKSPSLVCPLKAA